ncbi:hypothetical protein KPL71_024138 [Citrus sinensis]|uniref:Uncharacterized protein n=1 Tax=Citrus sinensis TaxID=2711 RepID=A0ACB8IQ17_CITSI|nr:hypothetical protein KPL71_024138 [Citrus sinensis]
MISRANTVPKQNSDDNVTCRTMLTQISCSSIPTISPSFGKVNISNLVHVELFFLTKSLEKAEAAVSNPFQFGHSKNDGENCSQNSSTYGSPISSWAEQGQSVKHKCTMLLMDALLERTIKHMLFLQSVTKHVHKLKQTEESKITLRQSSCLNLQIIKKEGGLLLKDNSEGGETCAFEVGSQSMVCPVAVEDLNSPRPLLVKLVTSLFFE